MPCTAHGSVIQCQCSRCYTGDVTTVSAGNVGQRAVRLPREPGQLSETGSIPTEGSANVSRSRKRKDREDLEETFVSSCLELSNMV